MISELKRQLKTCDEFYFSVAFITKTGTSMLIEELKQLQERGVKGYIVTGLYLGFSEPAALKELNKYSNIELKVSMDDGFHSKGYIFRNKDIYTAIIGSSNFTGSALAKNAEWNLKFSGSSKGKVIKDILLNFYSSFNKAIELENIITNYEASYKNLKEKKLVEKFEYSKKIIPNRMQSEALVKLENLRNEGKNKALLISATGTGKTYFAAFDVLAFNATKCLFIVHRENIARKAMQSFQKIIPNKKMGLYTGSQKDDCDYVFSTVQTLSKEKHLNSFKFDEFDYIIIDEVHHVGAPTYQKITNYFTCKFLLGMTATPMRSDDFNVFEIFDYNVACDIKLSDTMKLDLLAPFRYFGISDIKVDGYKVDENTSINSLCIYSRVDHLVNSINTYGHSGENVHGLIFASCVKEARFFAKELLKRNIRAIALDVSHGEIYREEIIKQLEDGIIDYIITVDIFNEGVDIPCVNQVVLMRPTQSAIIYIQQIGRGLRKDDNKDYVTIIDIIGNYKKAYNNIVALSQDRSGSKDKLKYFLKYGTDLLFGESTISFDYLTEEKIYDLISNTNFSTMDKIKTDYYNLKMQLGRVPYLIDFYEHQMISPVQILKESGKNTKYRTYYDVLTKVEKDFVLTEEEHQFIKYLSRYMSPCKRIHEWACLMYIIENGSTTIEKLDENIKIEYKLIGQLENTTNAIAHLTREIFTSFSELKKFSPIANIKNEKITLNQDFINFYRNNELFKKLVDDLYSFNQKYYYDYYHQENIEGLKLYALYNKLEAHKYANYDYSNGFQVSGYNFSNNGSEAITFITLEDNVSYENEISSNQVVWFSKSKRVLSRNNQLTNEGKIASGVIKLKIFIKKQSGDDYYYIGKTKSVESYELVTNTKNELVIKYLFNLENPIDEKILDLLNE